MLFLRNLNSVIDRIKYMTDFVLYKRNSCNMIVYQKMSQICTDVSVRVWFVNYFAIFMILGYHAMFIEQEE